MGSLSYKNQGVKYLLCVTDVFIKYAWIKHLNKKKTKAVLHSFVELVKESDRQRNKLLVDQGKKIVITISKNDKG